MEFKPYPVDNSSWIPTVLFAYKPTSHLQKEQSEKVMRWTLENGDTSIIVTGGLTEVEFIKTM